MNWVIPAWGRILAGYVPALSIEITRECPLHCPGCYAYGDDHLGGDLTLRELRDFKGQQLIDGIIDLVDERKPLHVSIVGGEPLVRYKELNSILPLLSKRGIHTQVVTSAVREIPKEWATIPELNVVVSIDGLQPEHDVRRTPATYDRILKHIEGHQVVVHCTVTRQQVNRPGYLEEFMEFWSAKKETRKIWMSLYTPQIGEVSEERLTAADRHSRRRRPEGTPAAFSEVRRADGIDRRLRRPALVSRRVRVRAHDRKHFGRPDDAHHALPVRRGAGLFELRLRGVSRPGGARPPSSLRLHPDRHALHRLGPHRRADAPAAAGGFPGVAVHDQPQSTQSSQSKIQHHGNARRIARSTYRMRHPRTHRNSIARSQSTRELAEMSRRAAPQRGGSHREACLLRALRAFVVPPFVVTAGRPERRRGTISLRTPRTRRLIVIYRAAQRIRTPPEMMRGEPSVDGFVWTKNTWLNMFCVPKNACRLLLKSCEAIRSTAV